VRSLSIVIPVFNELENIPRLHAALQPVLQSLPLRSEILFVDDGSRDGSDAALSQLATTDAMVRVVTLRRNFGQTAAMSAGISHADGDVIALLDGDLQNDPEDIPAMLAEIVAGADLVHGWRRDRKDRWLDRRLPSMLANRFISRVTGFPIHDLGCTLKLVRREIAVELNLYGEMHRFIPILANHRGARCKEIVVRHHPRRFGVSKYGLSRTLRVVLDLLTVVFLTQYVTSPMKLFGRLGVVSVGGGILAGVATVAMKLVGGVDMTGNPLLLAAVFGSLLGMQFVCLGMLGEMAMRTYYAAQNMTSYAVRRLQNFSMEVPPSSLPTSRLNAAASSRRAA
jgi:glycosyltransferase involved in cell wall biosynthesis